MGMQGMITCDVAAQAGAKEVYASDPSPERRAWAKQSEESLLRSI